jgi:hypothetical protein
MEGAQLDRLEGEVQLAQLAQSVYLVQLVRLVQPVEPVLLEAEEIME